MIHKYFISISLLLLATLFLNPIEARDTLSLVGDTLHIKTETGHNYLQWQKSYDKVNWQDIPSANSILLKTIIDSSSTGMFHFRAIFYDNGITGKVDYSKIYSFKIIKNLKEVEIGDWFRGGIVFHKEHNGHGLIVSDEEIGYTKWGCYGESTAASNLKNGKDNTKTISKYCNEKKTAAKICKNYSLYGYPDWYLPAINELNTLYKNKHKIGTFQREGYWSSTGYNIYYSWYKNFRNGKQGYENKSLSYYVRCIRDF